MAKRDCYEVLGIKKNATAKEIKKAYKKLAMKYHPDRTKGNDSLEDKFKEVKSAYEILSDIDKRKEYDEFGHEGFTPHHSSSNYGFNQSAADGFQRASGGADFNDIFADMFRQQHQPRPEKGANLRYRIKLTLEDAINGCDKEIKFPNSPKMLKISIPAGIDAGQSVRLAGKGEPGSFGGPSGDLLVEIELFKHALFTRVGNDLHCAVPISFPTAALGDTVKVPTLEGHINLKIPKGTQSGKKLRLKGMGIKAMKGEYKGDLIYQINVQTPTSLTREQVELLTKLGKTL